MIKPTYEDFSKNEKICIIIYLRSLLMNQFSDKSKFEERTIHLLKYLRTFGLSMEDLSIFSAQNHPFTIPATLKIMSKQQKEKVASSIAGLLSCDGVPTPKEVVSVVEEASKIIQNSILLAALNKQH